jgi:hypothetical protein
MEKTVQLQKSTALAFSRADAEQLDQLRRSRHKHTVFSLHYVYMFR